MRPQAISKSIQLLAEINYLTKTSPPEAIARISKNAEVLRNYAVALQQEGYLAEAVECLVKASSLTPHNLPLLEETINLCLMAGKYHQAQQLLTTYSQLSPQQPHAFGETFQQVITVMEEQQITESEIEPLINTLRSVLHHHHPDSSYHLEMLVLEDETAKWIHYGAMLHDLSVEEVAELTFELAEALIPYQTVTDHFVPAFHLVEE